MASVAADTDGTLYYSNDSGTLFAVAEGFSQNDIVTPPPVETGEPASPSKPESPSSQIQGGSTESPATTLSVPPQPDRNTRNTDPETNSVVRPQKPKNIKIKKKRKAGGSYKVTLSWKKGKNTKKTWIRIKGKKNRLLSGTKTTFVLKKGSYTIRLYGYRSSTLKSKAALLHLKLK